MGQQDDDGAGKENRTPTPSRAADFESAASTSSAIPARAARARQPANWTTGARAGASEKAERADAPLVSGDADLPPAQPGTDAQMLRQMTYCVPPVST